MKKLNLIVPLAKAGVVAQHLLSLVGPGHNRSERGQVVALVGRAQNKMVAVVVGH